MLSSGKMTSLLLADDSATIAKILTMALQTETYEIRSVLTAAEAIQELHANPPFFFLVDLTLPEKNGYEFARMVRTDAKLSQVRVVLLSSAFEPVDEAQYQACGADGLIAKPFDPSDLRAKLREIAGRPPRILEMTTASPTAADAAPGLENEFPPLEREEITDFSFLFRDGAPTTGADADSILSGLTSPPPPPSQEATVQIDTSEYSFTKAQTPPPAPKPAEATKPPVSEALSPNAEALAAFFSAELDAKPSESNEDSFDASLSSIEWGGPPEASLAAWSSPQ